MRRTDGRLPTLSVMKSVVVKTMHAEQSCSRIANHRIAVSADLSVRAFRSMCARFDSRNRSPEPNALIVVRPLSVSLKCSLR